MYSTVVYNYSGRAVTANSVAIARGASATIPYTPTGVLIDVTGSGRVRLNDAPIGVRVTSGSYSGLFSGPVLTVSILNGEMFRMVGADNQPAEAPIQDDLQDYAFSDTGSQSGALLTVQSAAHDLGTGDFTLTALFKLEGVVNANGQSLLLRRDGNHNGWNLGLGQFGAIGFWMGGSGPNQPSQGCMSGATNADDGHWHSVIVTRSGLDLEIYLDNNLLQVTRFGIPTSPIDLSSTCALRVGSFVYQYWSQEEQRSFTGLIEDVSIWQRALSSPDRIRTMTNQLTGEEAGLLALYPFNRSLEDLAKGNSLSAVRTPPFKPIMHSILVAGDNDHLLMSIEKPQQNRLQTLAVAEDASVTGTTSLTVPAGTPYLYGALIKDDGGHAFPDGVLCSVTTPDRNMLSAEDSDSAWVKMMGGSVQAFAIRAPSAGEWLVSITAPANAGFRFLLQTLPSTQIAQTMLATTSLVYPRRRPADGERLIAESFDDWDWWDYATAIVAGVTIAAVAAVAAPLVVAAAGAAATTTTLVAAFTGVAATEAAIFVGTLATLPGSVEDSSLKCVNYAHFDPRPGTVIYIWSFQAWPLAVGHASLKLSDGTYISWWPAGVPTETALTQKVDGFHADAVPDRTYNQDCAAEGFPDGNPPTMFKNPDFRIKVFGLDEAAIKAWWAEYRLAQNYLLPNRNCSTIVWLALCAGGLQNKLSAGEWNYYNSIPVWYPGLMKELGDDLAARTAL